MTADSAISALTYVRKVCQYTGVQLSHQDRPIVWPTVADFTLLIANAASLTTRLWNHPARLAEFQNWLAHRRYGLVPATLDGAIIPPPRA